MATLLIEMLDEPFAQASSIRDWNSLYINAALIFRAELLYVEET